MSYDQPNDIGNVSNFTVTSATVIGSKIIDETVHFIVEVRAQSNNTDSSGQPITKTWCTIKRYTNFEQFHELLLKIVKLEDLPIGCVLPAKRFKLWVNHTDWSFVEERTLLLDNYLLRCIQLSALVPDVNQLFVGFLSIDSILINLNPSQRYTPVSQLVAKHEFPTDAEVTFLQINTVRVVGDHVLYQLDCYNVNNEEEEQEWTVLKRFQQFVDLDTTLRNVFSARPEITSQFFPLERWSKLIYDHQDPHFVEHRRVLLSNYLQRLLLLEPVLYCEPFLQFIGISN